MRKTKQYFLSSALISIAIFAAVYYILHQPIPLEDDLTSGAMALGVSTDGHYAVSSHLNGELVLWDLQGKTARIVANHANAYSAYFIKNTPYYMWQDNVTNDVHVQDVQGNTVKIFHIDFPSYGEVMTSDLKTYIASDQAWNLYKLTDGKLEKIKGAYDLNGFLGTGKLLNMTLSSNNKFLVTAGAAGDGWDDVPLSAGVSTLETAKNGYGGDFNVRSTLEGVVLWNVNTGKPVRKLPGNDGMVYATISPDDKHVISGDETGRNLIWDSQTGKQQFGLFSVFGACWISTCTIKGPQPFKLPKVPDDYHDGTGFVTNSVVSIKFIDNNNNYLRFNYYMPYAVLYNVTDPKPRVYLPLEEKPFPMMNSFTRNQAIGTSPQAHVLVMAQGPTSGIIVYQYDSKTKTMQKVWAPDGPKTYAGIKGWLERQYDRLLGDWRWQSAMSK